MEYFVITFNVFNTFVLYVHKHNNVKKNEEKIKKKQQNIKVFVEARRWVKIHPKLWFL